MAEWKNQQKALVNLGQRLAYPRDSETGRWRPAHRDAVLTGLQTPGSVNYGASYPVEAVGGNSALVKCDEAPAG